MSLGWWRVYHSYEIIQNKGTKAQWIRNKDLLKKSYLPFSLYEVCLVFDLSATSHGLHQQMEPVQLSWRWIWSLPCDLWNYAFYALTKSKHLAHMMKLTASFSQHIGIYMFPSHLKLPKSYLFLLISFYLYIEYFHSLQVSLHAWYLRYCSSLHHMNHERSASKD